MMLGTCFGLGPFGNEDHDQSSDCICRLMFLREGFMCQGETSQIPGIFIPTKLINESFLTVQDQFMVCDDFIKNFNTRLSA